MRNKIFICLAFFFEEFYYFLLDNIRSQADSFLESIRTFLFFWLSYTFQANLRQLGNQTMRTSFYF